jgi:transcriptional regulator with XRE-family HTH domain
VQNVSSGRLTNTEGRAVQNVSTGRLTNQVRRRKMAALRAKGLTFEEIGRRLGVTKQRVGQLLQSIGTTGFALRCCDCGAEIASRLSRAGRNVPSLCLACLGKTPGHRIGERLKTKRLIAGLTQREVAAEMGITPQAVALFEKGTCKPTPETLAQLVAALGPGSTE